MLSFETTWINLEGIMLLEIGQAQKRKTKQNKLHHFAYTGNLKE